MASSQALSASDEWPTRSHRDTKRWCKGKVGKDHVWLKAEMRWGSVYHCIICGKQNYGRGEQSIASQIRQLRHAKGWTQAKLAEELGVTQARIADIENAQSYRQHTYTVELLRRVAQALGKRLVITFEDRE